MRAGQLAMSYVRVSTFTKMKVKWEVKLTCCLEMEAVERAACIGDIVYPLTWRSAIFWCDQIYANLLWFRNHHMAVHEYAIYGLRDAFQYRRTLIIYC